MGSRVLEEAPSELGRKPIGGVIKLSQQDKECLGRSGGKNVLQAEEQEAWGPRWTQVVSPVGGVYLCRLVPAFP